MLKKKLQLCLSGTRKGRANLNLSVMKKEHGHCVDLIMYTVPYLLINLRGEIYVHTFDMLHGLDRHYAGES